LNHNLINKNKKENENEKENKTDNESNSDDEIDSVEKLLKLRIKRGKSEYKPSKLMMNNKKQPIKKEISRSINIISTTNEKDCFKYLNGEDDTDENKEDKDDNKTNNNVINGSDKISHKEPNGKEIVSEDNNNNNGNHENNNKHRLIKIPNRFLNKDNMKHHLPTINEYGETKITKEQYDTVEYNMSNIKKTSTIKLNSMKIKNYELKLIDFGCAKIFSKYKKNFEDTIGTLIYCSPEVLKNNYNKKCDIWSCGVIMYVLLSGHFPFFGKTEEEITKKILSGKFKFDERYFSNISDKAKDLISKCLIYDKNKRISIEEVLKHEFFADDLNPNNIFQDEIDSKNVLNSLKNYSQQSKIYQTVLAYLSHNFADKEQLSRLKKIFYKIDLNLDGKLSKDELETAFKEAGMEMQKEQLNKVIESIDFDGNGYIEYEEFIRVTLPKEKLFTEANLKTAFDMFDLDKNGTISLNEFKEILGLGKIKDKNVNKELLKEIPIKGNEEITFEQFKKIIIG
jgi:Ca2+-binding EF-hand superfamily protein